MSIKVMSLILDRLPLRREKLLLMLILANWSNDQGRHIFPSVASIAIKARCKERAVQYQLSQLLKSGWLEVVAKGGGKRKTTEYRIVVERVQRAAPLELEGCNSTSDTVQSKVANGAIAVAPEPLEPYITVKPAFKKGLSPAVLEVQKAMRKRLSEGS